MKINFLFFIGYYNDYFYFDGPNLKGKILSCEYEFDMYTRLLLVRNKMDVQIPLMNLFFNITCHYSYNL